MKTIRFSFPHHTGGYGCSEPGDCSGEYVPLHVVERVKEVLANLVSLEKSRIHFEGRRYAAGSQAGKVWDAAFAMLKELDI